MNKKTRKVSKKKRFLFSLIMFLIPAAIVFAGYLFYTGQRTRSLYWYTKLYERGWKGNVHRADSELGFVPVPDAQGAEIIPSGSDIPMRYDHDGFRIPVSAERNDSHRPPIVLALGCSFTYGAATLAEDTFPYLVGQSLGGTARNAGVPSYGLSQMLVLARKLVPAYKPDYLLVQYSPWLVDRAMTSFAPTYYGKVPTPYFSVRQNELVLAPPVFMTKVMDLPVNQYRDTPVSVTDRVSFLWNVGLPLFVHDDLNMAYYHVRSAIGVVPKPAANPEQVTEFVYQEIAKVARGNGAQMIIVIVGGDHNPVPIPEKLFPSDAIIVDAHGLLLQQLTKPDRETYEKSYFLWRGSPPRIVDVHPNENAHKLIAEAIIRKIQNQENGLVRAHH